MRYAWNYSVLCSYDFDEDSKISRLDESQLYFMHLAHLYLTVNFILFALVLLKDKICQRIRAVLCYIFSYTIGDGIFVFCSTAQIRRIKFPISIANFIANSQVKINIFKALKIWHKQTSPSKKWRQSLAKVFGSTVFQPMIHRLAWSSRWRWHYVRNTDKC